MTLPECSLHPASGNDRGPLLRALEFVAFGHAQLAEIVGTVVGRRVSLDPSPKILDRIEVGGIRRKERNLNVPIEGVEVIPNQSAAMWLRAIPNHRQWLL